MMAERLRRDKPHSARDRRETSEYQSAGPRLRRAAELGASPRRGGLPRYLELSRRPLQMLIFLVPLIVLYALGTWRFSISPQPGGVASISAYERFNDFFAVFGITWLYLPGAAIVVVLAVWHLLVRDRSELHPGIPLVMWVEAWVLAIPLLVLSQILPRLEVEPALLTALQPIAVSGLLAVPITEYSWQAKLILSIGAGLYEELLFRMVGIAAVHFLLVDVFRLKDGLGTILAIIAAAVAFTFYHNNLTLIDGSFNYPRALFIFLSGLYFGGIFVIRGFGIVVGVHAIYDVLVLVVLPWLQS